MTYLDIQNRRIIVDWKLCKESHLSNDGWKRPGVTPFTLACYIFHGIHTLHQSPERVFQAVCNNWDSLIWAHSPISIRIWNKLFNNEMLQPNEWQLVLFPLIYIDSINTCVTSPKVKHICHPLFLSQPRQTSSDFFVCTDESYRKTVVSRTASKLTAYRYGQATGNLDILKGLRYETTKVIIPF